MSRFISISAQIRGELCSSRRRINSLQRSMFRSYYQSSKSGKNGEFPILEPVASQSWKYHTIAPIGILVFLGPVLYLHYNDEKRAIKLGSNKGSIISTNRPAIGGKFRLINTENHLVTESDLQGNWVLMYFGYSSSPDICPIEVQKMAQVIKILDLEHQLKVTPVFITIDPQRDSPSQLQVYLNEFDPRIIGLTGSISTIRDIAHLYRVFFKKVEEESADDYLVESSNNMYLLDQNMETVKYFGTEYNATQLANSVVSEMKKASK